MWMSSDTYVHIRIRLLLAKEQSKWNFWGRISIRFGSNYEKKLEFKFDVDVQFAIHIIEPNLFQENQKDLETATETLSEYLERDISAENLVDIKQKVQDKYR